MATPPGAGSEISFEQYIGKLISLKSKRGTTYEGCVNDVDTKAKHICFINVTLFGTEGRKFYKSTRLRFCEVQEIKPLPSVQATPKTGINNDPDIIQATGECSQFRDSRLERSKDHSTAGATVELKMVNDDEDLEGENDEGGKTIEMQSEETLKNRLVGDTPDNNCLGKKKVRRAGVRRTCARKMMRGQRQIVQPTRLLPGLKNHPSIYICSGKRDPKHDSASLDSWIQAVKICSNAPQVYKELLQDTGFGDFLRIQPFKVSSGGYMTDLVERYFPETHTLHLGTFEIGPTPLAWTMITGIRMGGDPLNLRDITVAECAELLGFEGTEGFFSNGKLKLDVLGSTLDFSKSPIDKDLDWMFRRLIVYFVGSCFFSDADLMVPIRLVSAMSDIRSIGRYDWGAATFSAFLNGMRRRTSEVSGSFSGFWPFLLLWAYEHIPYMRPLTYSNPNIFPRARQWNSADMDVPNLNDFNWSRLELEYLREDEVNFNPYGEWRDKDMMRFERSLSEKRIAFRGLDSWEVYMGERNVRQFGGGIRIPHPPPAERFGEISSTATTVPEELLGGIDAWALLRDEDCNYAEWFRSNCLGRIIDLNQFKNIMGGRLLELWLRVHRDGHKVISPQKLQALEGERRFSG